uniref:four helix bundle protein n=1 Tax=Alistipes sp. TaxID=1872444 RepID=UPI0040563394
MAIYTNLPVYRATYALMLSVSAMMPNLPRDCRYSFGQELRRRIMDMIILIYQANRTRRKWPLIAKMREHLLEVQVYVRLMNDLKYIPSKRYLDLVEQSAAISKQLAAWEKNERMKTDDEQQGVSD